MSDQRQRVALRLQVVGQVVAVDPFRGQADGLATRGNLLQKIGREEGEDDHLLDPAGGGLVTLGHRAEARTLADRLIPAPGGEDVPGQNGIRARGGVAQDDPGLDSAGGAPSQATVCLGQPSVAMWPGAGWTVLAQRYRCFSLCRADAQCQCQPSARKTSVPTNAHR
jgi:hypothetical protein